MGQAARAPLSSEVEAEIYEPEGVRRLCVALAGVVEDDVVLEADGKVRFKIYQDGVDFGARVFEIIALPVVARRKPPARRSKRH